MTTCEAQIPFTPSTWVDPTLRLPALAPGESVADTANHQQFKIVNSLGRRAESAVFTAQDAQQRLVALKLKHERTPGEVLRTDHEIVVNGMLAGTPGVVEYTGSGITTARGVPRRYVASRLASLGTLEQLIAATEVRGISVGLQVLKSMVQPLRAMNSLGIIHRDIKPSNIFVDQQADHLDFKLADFGGVAIQPGSVAENLAEQVGAHSLAYGISDPKKYLGTTGYVAKEYATQGEAGLSPSVDIYGLGETVLKTIAPRGFATDKLTTLPYVDAFDAPQVCCKKVSAQTICPQAPKDALELIDACREDAVENRASLADIEAFVMQYETFIDEPKILQTA